jgi:hypothetical protein
MTTKNTATQWIETQLLPGEKLVFSEADAKLSPSDEEINRRYVSGEIRIVTESARYSLAGILKMLQEKVETGEPRYKLDPEYQRRHRWNVERKSRLIESFLMNVPVPPVFLYEHELARFEVMDGRQRLNTLKEFYADEFELKGLQYWTELHGKTYSKLPSKVKDGIDRRYISSIILLKETASSEERAAQLKKMVFERLNSGGVRLSPQETRNAVYDGPLNQLCFKLSKNQDFCALWGIPAEAPLATDENNEEEEKDDSTGIGKTMYEKMDDVEMVLRFFAYRQIGDSTSGLNRIASFLDLYLLNGNKIGPETLKAFEKMFQNTVSLLYQVLGKEAFCRLKQDKTLGGKPMKIVYDPMMFVASQYCEERERLISGKALLLEEIQKMYLESGDLFEGRRTNAVDIQPRNKRVEKAFQNALAKIQP